MIATATPVVFTRLLVAGAILLFVLGNASRVFGAAAAAGATVQFGDLKFEAKSVAFACDGSRWTRNKFVELKEELGRAVGGMTAEQQFAVVFFADDAVTAFANGTLVPATDDNRAALRAWLGELRLGDRPTPMPGLTRAFEAKPEAVVFITDGKFRRFEDVTGHVASLNPKQERRLYAVGFFADADEDDSRDFVRFMTRLAERNGGSFKAVYADELRRFHRR